MKNRPRVHQMPSKPAAELSRPFVVVVDDEKRIADTLVLILKSKGYAAQAAHDGASALAIFRQKVPDLVVSDVVMPGMNGIEFAIFLKASYPQCHFLLFSGQPGTGTLLEDAKKKGYLFEILAKPLHPTFMLATVANMLSAPPVDLRPLPN